jgi:hypothetical protein
MPILAAISVLSAAVIGYEILLMRLFSINQWHHFAYMIISLALLGYGASGTFIALAQDWLLARFRAVFAAAAALFGLISVAAFAVAQRLPFNALELVWDPRQPIYLLILYVLLAVPFFCAATCVGLAFVQYKGRSAVVYCYDLLGAGIGAIGIIALLFSVHPSTALQALGAFGFAAAALTCFARPVRTLPAGVLLVLAVGAATIWPAGALAPRLSPYKGQVQTLHMPDTRVVGVRSSPLGLLTVVESPAVPFRHAPGLSLNATASIPPQLGVFADGGSMTAITHFDGRLETLAWLDQQSAALPYHLRPRHRVLVLGAGGGSDVLRAIHHRARTIDAVELDPHMVALVRRDHAAFAGGLYDWPDVRIHVAEARGFTTRSRDRYDLITLSLLDSFAASSAGLLSLSESTLYTVEALSTFLDRLAPGGVLAVTRWLKLPPRDGLKLLATAIAALEQKGVGDVAKRLLLIRSWNTITLLVKNGVFSQKELAAAKGFSKERSFDLVWFHGIRNDEVNRINVLLRPWFYEGARALLGDKRDAFLDRYKFRLTPATDDRPYFFHFFKWRTLPELLGQHDAGGVQQVEWGYLILVAALIQAILVSILLILLPLRVLRARQIGSQGPSFGRVAFYFFALGLAFLFVEIAFMQRFTLFLGHPLYATAVVLAAFLVFAGLGSGYSERVAARPDRGLPPIARAVAGIVVVALLYLPLLPILFERLIAQPDAVRIVVSVALIAPLGFFMGMPFPMGLSVMGERAPALLPWAWGINGCASVISAVLATLLAVHLGFTIVMVLALVLYVAAAAVFAAEGRVEVGVGLNGPLAPPRG